MPRPSKSKQNLQAQAALAQSSRTASITQCSTSSVSTSPAATVSTPSNILGVVDEESNDAQKTFENVCLHSPDSHEGLEEEEGYHTDDDLSELEDEELEESLKRQRVGESGQVIPDVFDTLIRGVNQKEWKKAESN
jgi:hypothetical protein